MQDLSGEHDAPLFFFLLARNFVLILSDFIITLEYRMNLDIGNILMELVQVD